MNNLSVLIFSKRGMEDAKEVIKDISGIADDIVIISGSGADAKSANSGKVRIFYMVPLGYADPSRAYGVKKCKYKWILHLDNDERLSDKLKEDIKEIIKNPHASAFALKRMEGTDSSKNRIFTWQVRLFRKDKVSFNGVIHNLPIVSGETVKLNSDGHFFVHNEDATEGGKRSRYLTIEAYTRRMSYRDVITLAKERGLPSSLINLYLKAKMTDLSSELSKIDYDSFLFAYSTIIYLSQFSKSSYVGWGGGFRYTYDYNKKKIEYFFSFPAEEQKLQFDISQEIRKSRGVINYLCLYSDNVIDLLNKKFKNSKISGKERFVYLLKSRHTNGPDYYKNL